MLTLTLRFFASLSPSYRAASWAVKVERARRYGFARLQFRRMVERCASDPDAAYLPAAAWDAMRFDALTRSKLSV